MSLRDKAQDLFIPLLRRTSVQSPANVAVSERKDVRGGNISPVKTSSSKHGIAQKARSPSVGQQSPSSATRYTISSINRDETAPPQVTKTDTNVQATSQSQPRRHSRRLSGKLYSPTSPITSLASRLKRVMKTDAHVRHAGSEKRTDLPVEHEGLVRVQAPTPFTSPDISPGPVLYKTLENPHDSTMSLASSSRRDGSLSASDNASVDDELIRTHSRGSDQSSKDRSHPPPSFPPNFYGRFSERPEPQKPPPVPPKDTWTTSTLGRSTSRKYTISATSVQDVSSAPAPKALDVTSTTDVQAPKSTALSPPIEFTASSVARKRDNSLQYLDSSNRKASHHRSQSYSPSKVPHATSSVNYRSDYTFHQMTHYYETCEHTSPPASRPLNAQPQIEPETSLTYGLPSTARSIIPGSCFDCDTAQRRDDETRILIQYNSDISLLENEIMQHQRAMEVPLSPVPRSHGNSHNEYGRPARTDRRASGAPGSASVEIHNVPQSPSTRSNTVFTRRDSRGRSHSITSNVSADHDEHESDWSQFHVRALQLRLHSLANQREAEVRKVWKGYTARWGPGTLGVVRKLTTASAAPSIDESRHSRNVSKGNSNHSRNSSYNARKDGSRTSSPTRSASAKVPLAAAPAPTTPVRSMATRSINTGSVRRGHARGTSRDSTYSNFSNTSRGTGVTYETSADTPDGRMRVDWIRR